MADESPVLQPGVQAFVQQLMARKVLTDDEANKILEQAYRRHGRAALEVTDAIHETNTHLKIMKMEIKSIKHDGVVYHAFVNNAADPIAAKNGSKLSDWQVEFFKKAVAELSEAPGNKLELSQLEALRTSKGSAPRDIDVFIRQLCSDYWLKASSNRKTYQLGVRTYLELPELVSSLGMPVPQFIYH